MLIAVGPTARQGDPLHIPQPNKEVKIMKKELFRFTLCALIAYLTGFTLNPAIAASQPSAGNGTHFCGVIDGQLDKQHSDQYPNRRYARTFAANLNVGEPRTVRMIYFLPNDRPYRTDVVQKMKDEILKVQTFYAEQMEAHGYGQVAFRIETDPQGEPIVHRMDGGHPDAHYLDNTLSTVPDEVAETFDLNANIYLIFIDNSTNLIGRGGAAAVGGVGFRWGKNSGYTLVSGELSFGFVAHELGHVFGLLHDFRDDAYIMSFGPGWNRLSACAAEFLSVHSYFNLNTPIEEGRPPTIELISSHTYPAGSQSVPVRLKVNDSEGLHQLLLFVTAIEPHFTAGFTELRACRGLTGDRDTIVEFDYDGVIPSDGFTNLSDPAIHPIYVEAVDTDGDVGYASFGLAESSPHHIATFDKHTDGVASMAFSPVDAALLATDSWDGTVKLWNAVTQQDITTLRGTAMAFSSDGVTLATGSRDGMVTLWDVVLQQDISTFKVHTAEVTSVSFSSDGAILATGSRDGTVKLWDVVSQRNIATLKKHAAEVTSVSFSSDGAILATGSRDGTVKLWDVARHRAIATFEDHTYAVNSVAFSPVDATLLATGAWDRTVKLWDVETRQNIATFEGHTDGVSSVVFSSNGSILATGSWDGTVKLWDIMTRINFATLGYGDPVLSVSFSSDDTTLASGTETGTVELWDTSGLMGARLEATAEIDIPDPNLRAAIAEAIGVPLSTPIFRGHLGNLTRLDARNANISDLTGLEDATNLKILNLGGNSVSDLSPLTGLTKLRSLVLGDNNILDISTVAGLTNLTTLYLWNNSISDISAVAGLTNLIRLYLWNNSVSDISAVVGLTSLIRLDLGRNNISDISSLAANMGLGEGDEVYVKGNPLSYQSIHTHIPTLQSRGVRVEFNNRTPPVLLKISGDNQKGITGAALEDPFVVEVQDANGSAFAGVPVTFVVTTGSGTLSTTRTTTDANGRAESTLTLGPNPETNTISVSAAGIAELATFHAISDLPFIRYILSIPAGISLIHIPLKVTAVDEIEKTIESVGDVYDALGGASRVNFLITYDPATQGWLSYFVPSDKGTSADAPLADDTGIIAGLRTPVSIQLRGDPLGTDGTSTITLNQGLNLVGLPLNDSRIMRVSDLFALEGIGGNVPVIILTDDGEFELVGRARDPGDIEIIGGQSFILTAQRAAIVGISGDGWTNVSGTAAAPSLSLTGVEVKNTTPVLGLRGSIVDEVTGVNPVGIRVTVKNLSTGRVVVAITAPDEAGYRSTVVDIETGRAATVGDILEISAQSPTPFIGVEPLQYTVTAEDVKQSLIQLPNLVAYEIPAETELLRNYPNPFNPETWIPYRLAEDAFVTLTIYDLSGQIVRTLEVGHRIAAAYESRSKAIYWDGRNKLGERMASGVYFYTLTAGDYSATRKMLILK